MRVAVGRRKLDLKRLPMIGQGGEATIYDLGAGTAAKIFKLPDHPDYAHSPEARIAAQHRLDEHQSKLGAFPANAPAGVVKPAALIEQNGRVVGYTMPLLDPADVLLRYAADRELRKATTEQAVVGIFRELHALTAATHRAGIVIGDFNDLNVLIHNGQPWLIDADSMQYGGWACRAFTERFLDPRLAVKSAARPMLTGIYDPDADWFAFACMLMETLLFVGPFGGVHRPRSSADRIPHAARSLHGISVFHPDVRYPKPARPMSALPDDLLHHFQHVFEKQCRGKFPIALLESLRWTRCTRCGTEHARATCPGCTAANPAAIQEVRRVRGNVIAIRVKDAPAQRIAARFWLADGALWRAEPSGPARIGAVASRSTQIWVGPTFGFGFYRIAELTVAFVFDGRASGLNDGVRVPRIAGQLIAAHAVLSEQLCWFFTRTQEQARTVQRLTVVHRDGTVRATTASQDDDQPWFLGADGACASGEHLFVPTDDGIVRLSAANGTIHESAAFPDTEPFVTAQTKLRVGPDGLYLADDRGIVHLTIRATP